MSLGSWVAWSPLHHFYMRLNVLYIFLLMEYIFCMTYDTNVKTYDIIYSLHSFFILYALWALIIYMIYMPFQVIILAPSVKHADTGALMNYTTWGTRGWCRVERTATALSAKENETSK